MAKRRKTTETDFALTYAGAALEDGRMPVRDLAPALRGLGELFTEASAILHPDRPPVALDIRATREGSFDILLILSGTKGVWDQLTDIFSSDDVTALVNLRDLVVAGGIGVFWLVKRLRGRKVVKNEPLADGEVLLTLDDGTNVKVPAETLKLYRNVRVRQKTHDVVEPLNREGVEALEFRTEREIEVSVGQEDAGAFEVPETDDIPLLERTTEMALSITSVVFTEGNKWRFSDGDNTFFAALEDKAFIDRVEHGIEAFRKGDILKCRLKVEQVQRGTGLYTDYRILEVLEHIPSPTQLPLPGEEAAE